MTAHDNRVVNNAQQQKSAEGPKQTADVSIGRLSFQEKEPTAVVANSSSPAREAKLKEGQPIYTAALSTPGILPTSSKPVAASQNEKPLRDIVQELAKNYRDDLIKNCS